MIVRKIGVLSVGKVAATLYALLGLIIGAFVALLSLLGAGAALAARGEDGGGALGGMFSAVFGVAAIILFPLMYGIMGFLVGMLMAFLYNLVAGFVGGVELDVS